MPWQCNAAELLGLKQNVFLYYYKSMLSDTY